MSETQETEASRYALVPMPSTGWVDVCQDCGAMVLRRDLHDAHHAREV